MTRICMIALAIITFTGTAHADCAQARKDVLTIQDEHDRWYPAAIREAQGADTVDFDFSYFVQCMKMLPIAKKRLGYVQKILVREEVMQKTCRTEYGEPLVGGYPATEMRSILKEYIAVCGGEN